ncbi:hypothetical protein TrVE_jg11253 [Triparma verrucosa]|uniref:Uncharacterized protein n=1 Tax=Triparma verrucosa TaxID=1606542 RepID=A0A9W7KWJ1_9STRA|nr:hypothetical protein TrVE_jg11253 [Triparma verrucosa]
MSSPCNPFTSNSAQGAAQGRSANEQQGIGDGIEDGKLIRDNFPSLSPFLNKEQKDNQDHNQEPNREYQTLSIGTRSALNTHIRQIINTNSIESTALFPPHSSDYWTPQKPPPTTAAPHTSTPGDYFSKNLTHLKTPDGNIISDPCTSRGDEIFFESDSDSDSDSSAVMADVFMECVKESQMSSSSSSSSSPPPSSSVNSSPASEIMTSPVPPGDRDLFVSPGLSPDLSPMIQSDRRSPYAGNSRELEEEFQSVATPIVKMEPEVDMDEVKGSRNERYLRNRHKALSPTFPPSPSSPSHPKEPHDSSLNSVSLLSSFQSNHQPNMSPFQANSDSGPFQGSLKSVGNKFSYNNSSLKPLSYWSSTSVTDFSDGSNILREEKEGEDKVFWKERLGEKYAFN